MTEYVAMQEARWTPQTEEEILKAIDEGLMQETHYQEIKREIGTTPGERKELARDLASLALDGGSLIVGIDEDKPNRTWHPMPQPLVGMGERVEQIATSIIDPPLLVRARDVPSETGLGGRGYLVIEVPASYVAPHMVDGAYYGRGDRTRHKLSDVQVLLLHTRRESSETLVHRLLESELQREPMQPEAQQNGHLYAVAQPIPGRHGLAAVFLAKGEQLLRELVMLGDQNLPERYADHAPTPTTAHLYSRRSQGRALSSLAGSGAGRTLRNDGYAPEDTLLDIEIREDGGIRLLVGRMTALRKSSNDVDPVGVICDALAAMYMRRLVNWARALGEKSGYTGAWAFGVQATQLRGLSSSASMDNRLNFYSPPAFDSEDYRESTLATSLEMNEQPWSVGERLVGRLFRALGTEQLYSEILEPIQA
jgi:hypothetical protein